MENFGFIRVASAVPAVSLGNGALCADAVIELVRQAQEQNADLVVFPELCLSGSTCGNLLNTSLLEKQSVDALNSVLVSTRTLDITIVVGMLLRVGPSFQSVAAVCRKGSVIGIHCPAVPQSKVSLLGKNVTVGNNLLFKIGDAGFAVVCGPEANPGNKYILQGDYRENGAQILLCMASAPEYAGSFSALCNALKYVSKANGMACVYAGAGSGESDTDALYAGHAVIAENGVVLGEDCGADMENSLLQINDIDIELLDNRFAVENGNKPLAATMTVLDTVAEPSDTTGNLLRIVDAAPFTTLFGDAVEAFDIQAGGLAARMRHIKATKVVLGVSGGLDSTLALLVAARAFDIMGLDRSGIIGVTMPGFGTSDRTRSNASLMMELLGVSIRQIDITESVREHFAAIGHDENNHNVVYENAQARERTQILMDISNQCGAFVLGTGDLSELALGWCTYNGDQMSMYGVNGSVPKTVIPNILRAALCAYFTQDGLRQCLEDVISTPVSPELLPTDQNGEITQKTQDLIGPYVLHDFFLYHLLYSGFDKNKIEYLANIAFESEYDSETIKQWLDKFFKRFFSQQFKRSCMPDGVAVTSLSLSPRGAWNMPSTIDASNF